MSRRKRIGILSILAGLCFVASADAELVITEIMSDSAHEFSIGCDWWELTNTGLSSINLTGYSWDDDHRRPGQNVFAGVTISAGESIIIRDLTSGPEDLWKVEWGLGAEVSVYDPSYFSGNFSRLGDSDGVFLYDSYNVPVTSATYASHAAGVSHEWATDGTYLAFSVVGENGAYLSATMFPDVGSPGYAVSGVPCSRSGRMLYWTDKDTAKVQRMNLDSGCVENILTSADGLVNPRGFAIDPSAEKMYWADSMAGVIHRSGLDGSGDVQIVTGLLFPSDIALDAGKIYFAETGADRIRRVNVDGTGPIEDVITGVFEPYYIELDSTNSRIYWSDVDNSVIHRANLDGTGVEDFITGMSRVRDIALDLPAGKIYWGDRESSKIQRANLDGTGAIEDLFDWTDGLDRPHGLLLQPDEGKIYWTDTRTLAVHRGNMDGSGAVENLVTGLDGPWALAVVMVRNVIYVDADAPGADDGSNWENAFNCLQDALSAARLGDEIRVAQGIYKPDENADNPTGTGNRQATFQLKNGVALKGGYAGYGDPDPDRRDIDIYETILSGDLHGNDAEVSDPCDLLIQPTRSENSYHVITGGNIDETTVLDGFTITAGNANGSQDNDHDCGGGVFNKSSVCPSNPTVTACTFTANSAVHFGGGMFHNQYGDDECGSILTDCTFIGNAAGQSGGGMSIFGSDLVVANSAFRSNHGQFGGGGMNIGDSNTIVTNCTFSENSTIASGGAMWNNNASPVVIDCIFNDNSANFGGGMENRGRSSKTTLTNCVFAGNTADRDGGGIRNHYAGSPILTNCSFSGNAAADEGGAMFNYRDCDPVLTNCTFSNNSAQAAGGGIHNHFEAGPTLTNCILWGNVDNGGTGESAQIFGGIVVAAYSCIQGLDAFTGNNNIAEDPLFRDADGPDSIAGTLDDNLRLDVGSPCIDYGDSSAIPHDVETDLDGRPRVLDADCDHRIIVDMGAYEFSYAYIGDFDSDCDVDFRDFAVLGLAWLTEPASPRWNPVCDIAMPQDSRIDWLDVEVFAENWLVTAD